MTNNYREAIKDKNDLYDSVTPCTYEYNRSYLENYSKTQQTAHTHLIHLVTSNTSCSLSLSLSLSYQHKRILSLSLSLTEFLSTQTFLSLFRSFALSLLSSFSLSSSLHLQSLFSFLSSPSLTPPSLSFNLSLPPTPSFYQHKRIHKNVTSSRVK